MDIKSTAQMRRYGASSSDSDLVYNQVSLSYTTAQTANTDSKLNKRKRRSTFDDKESETNPAKKPNLMGYSSSCPPSNTQKSSTSSSSPPQSSPFSEIGSIITDTQSSSECQSTTVAYDYSSYSPASPDDMSPSSCPFNPYEGWHQDCDIDPVAKTKVPPCRAQCLTKSSNARMCPLPALSWANAQDVWTLMCEKDKKAAADRDPGMLKNHPGLQARMRAILLDWLIEVCEVYKLHRETYFLAVDYLDRYLSRNRKVQKTHLQLIGITCLFVAAKVEEIYPPKIGEFAYVTDGACQEEDILQHELLLLKALDWNISPVTVMGWLGVYMQLNVTNRTPLSFQSSSSNTRTELKNDKTQTESIRTEKNSTNLCKSVNDIESNKSGGQNSNVNNNKNSNKNSGFSKNSNSSCSCSNLSLKNANKLSSHNCNRECEKQSCSGDVLLDDDVDMKNTSNNDDSFIYPQFSGMEFAQTAQLVDLCSLDLGIANYPYSVTAAAAMSHTFNREIAERVSGLEWSVIEPCAKWMEPFFQVICEEAGHLYLLEQNEQVKSKFGLSHICPNIVTDDSHIIQTHSTSMDMFDKVMMKREHCNPVITLLQNEASPAVGVICPEGLLTPPASSRKPLDDEDAEEDAESNRLKNEAVSLQSKN